MIFIPNLNSNFCRLYVLMDWLFTALSMHLFSCFTIKMKAFRYYFFVRFSEEIYTVFHLIRYFKVVVRITKFTIYRKSFLHDFFCADFQETNLPGKRRVRCSCLYLLIIRSISTWIRLILPFTIRHDFISVIFGLHCSIPQRIIRSTFKILYSYLQFCAC